MKSGNKTIKLDRCKSNLRTGKDSVVVKELMKRIDASPLDKVKRLELNNIIEQTIANGIAFDTDMFVRQLLVSRLKEFDINILDYESDLYVTENKINKMSMEISFHEKVLNDLKKKYIETEDPEVLNQIDERTKQILKFNSAYNNLLELRAKIRSIVDKKNFQESQLKIKENQLKGNIIDIKDVDLSALE